jgi:hypothetical protein
MPGNVLPVGLDAVRESTLNRRILAARAARATGNLGSNLEFEYGQKGGQRSLVDYLYALSGT